MSAAKEKMTFGDLEPLICDADNMVDVLLNAMEHAGLTKPTGPKGHFLTQGEGELLFFIASVAGQMTRRRRTPITTPSKENRHERASR